MILDCATLQYWHSRFNYMFFENALEPAIIRVYTDENIEYDEDTQADFIGALDPFAIRFFFDVSDSPMFTLTVLLHEMVHQYCRENGIEDIDGEDYSHSDDFREAAEEHGLIMNGYKLAEWAQKAIEEQIALYDVICEACDPIANRPT